MSTTTPQQPLDLNAALMRAERYGHNLIAKELVDGVVVDIGNSRVRYFGDRTVTV